MKYFHEKIEEKWQKYWAENKTFKAENPSSPPLEGLGEAKPKYYVLDMFPYPSGAGLHVGHPLGYIASDIVARFKRHKGFNVLHPQGYDSFGLPAEQYAIQTGQHPEKTTRENIARYREQLDKIGFSFDWSREVRTSNADYYKHTQWIFIQLFNSWYNKDTDKAEDISTLISIFEKSGNATVHAVCDDTIEIFFPSEWSAFSSEEKQKRLLQYRLTYLAETEVNWCPALGTVLANDEIVNGLSERGGHLVIRKKMTQWSMRISAYAERLLQGLETIDWSESIKESQRNWIGKSVGATVKFSVLRSPLDEQPTTDNRQQTTIDVFTTRPDTIFGVTFMTLAPEHELVSVITTEEQKAAVESYVEATAKRSERERMADVKTISGVFTGAYAEHPFTKESIPVWIGDYVLAGYGTGAVMAVPCGDERDYAFATHFKESKGMPEIRNIFSPLTPEGGIKSEQIVSDSPPLERLGEVFTAKEGFELINSDFLNGLGYKAATKKIIEELEKIHHGKGKTNYRLRDAVFSRQRYWGEPFPVYYVNGMPQMIDSKYLPIILPEVEKYLPTEDGQPPLGNATDWAWDTINNKIVSNILCQAEPVEAPHNGVYPLELNTMPGWAGSSWYWMRYMDAHNDTEFASAAALKYWESVDLYIGGSEHATGHLLYARFWNKFLKDRGYAPTEEPFKKLINQGMILGMSAFVYRVMWSIISVDDFDNLRLPNVLVSSSKRNDIDSLNIELNRILKNTFPERNDIGINKVTFSPIHIDLAVINDITNELNIEAFRNHPLYSDYKEAVFICEGGKVLSFGEDLGEAKYIVGREVEKMSKSKYNVVNPDDICNDYGADTLRLYEMFLGPLEQAKPWNTAGITGVSGFLKKLWKLYHSGENETFYVDDSPPSEGLGEAFKSLHKTIKKVTEDIENFSFNTSVSQFMICVNELSTLKCNHRKILEPLAIVISPYAPHIAEELWSQLGNEGSISTVAFPICEEKHLVESEKEYPVSFNGKMRFTIKLPLDLTVPQIQEIVLADERTIKQLDGRTPNKVIIVPGKVINLVE